MVKRLVTGLLVSLLTLTVNAQWTAKDSLNLQRILNGDGELKLNQEVIKQIDFGKAVGVPMQPKVKNWLLPDESLPSALPEKKKLVLTLHPYTANTRFDWDPIYQKKMKVGKDTWRGDPFYALKTQVRYTNGAKTPMNSGTIGDLNLMAIFQKNFWDKKGNERRARTLEVLKAYGDSTTVALPTAIPSPAIR